MCFSPSDRRDALGLINAFEKISGAGQVAPKRKSNRAPLHAELESVEPPRGFRRD
jgi:hypothetical protein